MRALRVVLLGLAVSLSLLAAESPFSGTWSLNLEKSKLTPPHAKGETVRVDADDKGIKITDDITDSQGQTIKLSYDAKFDGKDYPATENPTFDSISFQRVNGNTLKAKGKKAGKVVADYTIVVSEDGKTTTVTFGPEGKPIKDTAVYDKQ